MLLVSVQQMHMLLIEKPLSSFGNGMSVGFGRMLALLNDDPSQHVLVNLKVIVDFRKG